MAVNQIAVTAQTPEQEGMMAAFDKWCKDHNVPINTFFLAIMPKVLFCLQNYTRADERGRAIVTLNLAETVIDTHDTIRRKPRPKRRGYDSAF